MAANAVQPAVYLVGAGPGDPELLTMKAHRLLQTADVVVYDRLVSEPVMALIPAHIERIFAGKRRDNHFMRQVEINALLVTRAQRGQTVVRLKGGDPLIFGRGGEEIEALVEAGISYQVVPGITSASGCASSLALPLTHRDFARTLVYVTGHSKDGEPDLNWQALCQPGQTLVFYMGHKVIERLCTRLIEEGLSPDLPAILIENGTRPDERRVAATLNQLPAKVLAMDLQGPALIIIGEVVGLAPSLDFINAAMATSPTLGVIGPHHLADSELSGL